MDGERLLLILATFLSLPVVVSTSCPTSPFTNSNGSISSPGFNTTESYGDNLACAYRITVPVNRRVILEFKNLSILGTMPDCEGDSLEIFVGCSNTSIGKFCSCSDLAMPKKIYSLDNCMTLVFKSDGSKSAAGFEAQYTSIDNNTALDPGSQCSLQISPCGALGSGLASVLTITGESYISYGISHKLSTDLLRSSEGIFYTPNWPLTYPPNDSCSWTFSPSAGKIVRLFFMSFKMEEKFECEANRPSVTADEIRINGTTSTGFEKDIVPRICAKPDEFYAIKQMKTITVRFASNQEDESSGAIAGYATYRESALNSSSPGCQAIQVPELTNRTSNRTSNSTSTTVKPSTSGVTGKETLVKALGVVGAVVLAVVVSL